MSKCLLLYLCLVLLAGGCQQISQSPSKQPMSQDTFQLLRESMVQHQLVGRDITDPVVIQAMKKVPRHLFIPEQNRPFAYDDRPVSIGYGQTISQPYIVALMTQVLQISPGEKVLEIGTGSGYQAAILSEIKAKVYTIEIIPELAEFAEKNLKAIGYADVVVKAGDGYHGWKEYAPFDAIIVTCAPDAIPQPLQDQLKSGGRMIIPVGIENQIQDLVLVKKSDGQIKKTSVAPVRFVPMIKGSDQ